MGSWLNGTYLMDQLHWIYTIEVHQVTLLNLYMTLREAVVAEKGGAGLKPKTLLLRALWSLS